MYATLRAPLIVLSILILTTVAGGRFASAQAQGIEIQPAVIEGRIDPGNSYSYSVRVSNISDTEQTYYLSSQDISGLTDEGLPIFDDNTEKTPYELSSWITLSVDTIVIPPRGSKSVSFTVDVPKDAAPGAHFGGIFLDTTPQKLHTNGSAVGMKVGPIINLRVAGEATEDAQLREFSTGHIVYGSASNVDLNVRVENLGNVLVRPRGLVEITDMRGSKVDVLKVNDSAGGVFPKTDKTFTSVWSYDGFAIGRYQAVVSLVYGDDGNKTISAATSFWVLPLKPILTVLGSIFAILLVLYIFVRMYISRKLREMGGGRGDLYARRNQSPVPRLLIIALALLFLAIVFLVLLFLMFA
jgi:hypothetical protein